MMLRNSRVPRFYTFLAVAIITLLLLSHSKLVAQQIPAHLPEFHFPASFSSPGVQRLDKIWQIRFSPDPKSAERSALWTELNPNHTYTLLDSDGGNEFVITRYIKRPDIVTTYLNLGSRIFKSDYLRYLALATDGGVYADLDAIPKKAVDQWIPEEYKDRARAAIGLEFDFLGERDPASHKSMEWNGMVYPVQFCQWTIAAHAHHPLLEHMVEQVTLDLHELARKKNTSIRNLVPDDNEVISTTGPMAWSKMIYKELSAVTSTNVTWINITGIKEPRLFGDILILPINAYAGGQEHSGSIRGGDNPEQLVAHLFEGFWKSNWNKR